MRWALPIDSGTNQPFTNKTSQYLYRPSPEITAPVFFYGHCTLEYLLSLHYFNSFSSTNIDLMPFLQL
jgi:hypothetical protein